MNKHSAFLALAMTAAVLVGIQPPADAAPTRDVYPDTPVLLGDLDVDQDVGGARIRDSLVFTGIRNGEHELWITDGTPEGTRLLRDIWPGPTGSGPAYFSAHQGRVYFMAATPGHGSELWVTDGTSAGTREVADVWEGVGSSVPRQMTGIGGLVYFTADSPTTGRELWVTDGTTAGTRLHTDIRPGPQSSNPHSVTAHGSKLFFGAFVSETVIKPFVADPAPGSAARLDVEPIGTELFVNSFAPVGDRVLLGTRELWETRGVVGDARLLKDVNPGAANSYPRELTRLGDRVVFTAETDNEGREAWASDGTPAGTVLLRDIWPGDRGRVTDLEPVGGAVFFEAGTGDAAELWLTGGTPASTRQVTLPQGATEIDHIVGSAAGQVTVLADTFDSTVVFTTDGTAGGTRVLPELSPGPDGAVNGIGGLGATQIIEVVPDDGQPRLYAWTAARSTTKAKPKASYDAVVAKRKQVRVTVRVKASTGERLSGGLVTLTRKGRVVGRARLVEGVAKVRIRVRLQPGKRHHLRASWTGTVDAATSTSPRFTVRIRARR